MAMRIFNRFELQAWTIKVIKANVNRYIWFGIQSIVRQLIYAFSWIGEHLGLNAFDQLKRYHVHRATGVDLQDFAKDFKIPIDLQGKRAKGKIRFYGPITQPDVYQLDPNDLRIFLQDGNEIYYYEPVTLKNITFTKGTDGIPTSIVEYQAVAPGADYNFFDSSSAALDLSTPNDRISSLHLLGDGFKGGTDETYSDAELRKQIWDYFAGLGNSTLAAIRFKARQVPGVVYADVGRIDPTPGEITVYVADENGLTNPEILSEVERVTEGIGIEEGSVACGVTPNYRKSRLMIMYFRALVHDMENKDNLSDIIYDVSQYFEQFGFKPEFESSEILKIIKEIEPDSKPSNFRFFLITNPEFLYGVTVLAGSVGNWSKGMLRWNPSAQTLSFADGEPVNINELVQPGGDIILKGSQNNVFIIVRVEHDLLPIWNFEEELSQIKYSNNLDRSWRDGEFVQLSKREDAIVISTGGLIGAT